MIDLKSGNIFYYRLTIGELKYAYEFNQIRIREVKINNEIGIENCLRCNQPEYWSYLVKCPENRVQQNTF